ncbi:MAG: DUF1634 domain-containing protein [Acidobacteria bacterium]|nr:DUF1634 domain-containing protein [Acidobacteriota bacterium]
MRLPDISDKASSDLEAAMRKVSVVVSLVALGLMMVGFVATLMEGASFAVSGDSVVSLSALVRLRGVPMNLLAMNAGIVLLALLPSARVLLAVWLYVRRRDVLNIFVALVVLLELLLSMRTGS